MQIPLTKGKYAEVDASDYAALSAFSWFAERSGRRSTKWYAARNGDGCLVRMHRQLLAVDEVDHVNGNGLDNRRANLRPATRQQNGANAKKWSSATSSKYKGVSWDRQHRKWSAYIHVAGLKTRLGLHTDEKVAALSYDKAAVKAFGEFARTNFPKEI